MDKRTSWLPLEYYEDRTLDKLPLEEWASLLPLGARVLFNASGELVWKQATVVGFNSKRFAVQFESGSGSLDIPRVHICFDDEDPVRFVARVADAHKRRLFADSLIRYKYYVENMPIQEG